MSIISKIKAFFSVGGTQFSLDLKSAEVRQDRTFLHPADNDNVTYVVKASNVQLLLNDGEDIAPEDFMVVEGAVDSATKPKVLPPATPKPRGPKTPDCLRAPRDPDDTPPHLTKRKITFTVYEDEFSLINRLVKESGYKRSIFFVACIQNSQKKSVAGSLSAECNRVQKSLERREQEQKERLLTDR